jgi:hypothetical protein
MVVATSPPSTAAINALRVMAFLLAEEIMLSNASRKADDRKAPRK